MMIKNKTSQSLFDAISKEFGFIDYSGGDNEWLLKYKGSNFNEGYPTTNVYNPYIPMISGSGDNYEKKTEKK